MKKTEKTTGAKLKNRFWIYFVSVTGVLLLFFTSCGKEDLPVVTTASVSEVANTSAVCGGEVTDDGGKTVIARGVVWSISENSDLNNNDGFTNDGEGLGEFTSIITGLTPNTRYYVRAYATSNEGTGYGRQKKFTTFCDDSLGEPCPGMPQFTDPRDGYTYNTVLIGNQCWMRENLAWLPEVHHPFMGSSSSPRYYVYGYEVYDEPDIQEAKNTDNYKNYGVLYNWQAAQDACPSGWRLPSINDWHELVNYLGGSSVAGGKLKSTRTEPDPHPRWNKPNKDAANESGFTAVPGGGKDYIGYFISLGQCAYFWSYSHENSPYLITILYKDSGIGGYENPASTAGASVRCIRDDD